MADTGWKSPGTAVNGSGSFFSNPENVKASDDSYATDISKDGDDTFQVIKGGSTSGNIKTITGIGGDDLYLSVGGSSDLWGNTLSVSDVNSSNFGLQFYANDSSGDIGILDCTNFGLSIPTGSTINGIEARIEYFESGGAMNIDHIQIKVYYTESGATANAGVSSSTTSSPSPSILGKASTSQSSDAVLLSSPSVSTAIGVNVSANSDEISLTNLSPSLSAGVNLGVSVQESVLSSTAVLASGKAITSPSTDEVLFTSLSPSLIAGIGVNVDSGEVLLSSLSPSLNVSADMSVDEVSLTSLGIDSFSVSKDLTAIAFSIVNPPVGAIWDYLFINKPKNITNWSSKSKNSTTWIKRPKVLTNWEEI